MALITCPECGGKVSDKAKACIHCGYPINNDTLSPDNDLDKVLRELGFDDMEKIEQGVDGDEKLICPLCGSSLVHSGARGYKFVSGWLGSGKVKITCLKCGHTWDPKKKKTFFKWLEE